MSAISLLRRTLPSPIRRAIADRLRRILCQPESTIWQEGIGNACGKPGERNPWWQELEKMSSGRIFKPPSRMAKEACAEIRQSYRPVLKRYGINLDEFFWGSIKNEEAEAIYQLVLNRKRTPCR